MNIIVSISQFRENISDYLAQVQSGFTVTVHDKKKKMDVAELIGKKKLSAALFKQALEHAAGVFNTQLHSEWKTKKQVIRWLAKSRNQADRIF